MTQDLPAGVAAFRQEYRATEMTPGYSGWRAFAASMACGLALIALMAWTIGDLDSIELAVIPVTFLYANLVEWVGHRYPMHNRYRIGFMAQMYRRHAAEHHRFYTHDAMIAESEKDFEIILFHPVFLIFFFGIAALPSGALVAWLISIDAACLYGITALAYALCYEFLHLAYHQPPDSWVRWIPGIDRLRRHHTVHHDPRLMRHHNFNITFPICDAILGTTHQDSPSCPVRS